MIVNKIVLIVNLYKDQYQYDSQKIKKKLKKKKKKKKRGNMSIQQV